MFLFHRGFSQAFYREKLYETALGFQGLEDFMQNYWEKWALSKGDSDCAQCAYPEKADSINLQDPENLLVMLRTW